MQWRGTAAVAGLSAAVAALVSAGTTLLLVRPDGAPTAAARTSASGTNASAVGGLPALVSDVAGGVVRIETTACSGGSVGSGFLIAPDLVATVAHVLTGAHKIVLTAGGSAVPGSVVGLDAAADLALLRADRPFAGHVFGLSDRPPQVGTPVVGLGYPLGGGLSLIHGRVSALDRTMTVTGGQGATAGAGTGGVTSSSTPSPSTIAHLLQIDGVFTGGDSGGPLVAADGTVVGLVEARATQAQGVGFAVSGSLARTAFARWQAHPQPVQVSGDCAAPVGPPDAVAQVSDVSGSPDGPAVQTLLSRFATALNAGRYSEAYALFSPAARRRATLQEWTAQERSSRLFDIVVHQVVAGAPAGLPAGGAGASPTPGTGATTAPAGTGAPGTAYAASPAPSTAPRASVTPSGGRSLRADITFTSVQDSALGANGQVCSLWHLSYLLVWSGGWRIDRATGSSQAC